MKKEEAIDLIEQILVNYRGTRQEHSLLIQAMEVIKKLEEPKEEKK